MMMDKDTLQHDKKSKNKNKNTNSKNQKEKKTIDDDNKETISKNIRIYSFNSRGFDETKQKFCLEVLNTDTKHFPVMCNQENFVLKGNEHLIKKALKDYHVFVKPATKSNLEGRPVNGMFVALPIGLRNKAKDVSPNHNRIQAVLLKTDKNTIMIVNAYFPPDPKTTEYKIDPDLEDVLATIENLVKAHQCNDLLLVGDLNCDYARKNGRVARVQRFLSSNIMETAWETFEVDYTHEFENNDTTYTSTIDHILWNQNMKSSISDCNVLHLINNTSDHSPIYCDLNKEISSEEKVTSEKNENNAGVSTKSMNEEDWKSYHDDLETRLNRLATPECANCRNIHCRDEKHKAQIDSYVVDLLEAIDTSINTVAGKKRNNRDNTKVMPGWNDIVQPFYDDAAFWNAVWKSAGKPLNNPLHTIMKRTRNLYHYAIRKCKRASEYLRKDKLLNSCVNGSNNIFDEIRKMRKTENTTPSKIDGHDNPAQRFGEVYGALYNSANDTEEMKEILVEINARIDNNDLEDVDLVTPDIVTDAVKGIKTKKSDPMFAFNSDCIKQSPTSLYEHLACMIKCFLIHGHVSNMLLVATIIPLVKNKLGDTESSDNYRSIALSSVILKIYDWIVLILFGEKLGLDELQFSYQKDCSTTMCTWLVVETVSYFTRHGSDVNSCFMDMKKAFDMVKHATLFRKLIDRKVPLVHVRLFIIMYMNQEANVRWKGTLSDAFSIINGVKQGVVISAILFCIYIDDLIKVLRKNSDGCWIGNTFLGIIIYADDIVLLSPSLDGLQNMINTCCNYAKEHNLTFSTNEDPSKSKTKCMVFQKKKRVLRKLKLDKKDLPWVNSVKHLGSTITNNIECMMDQDLVEKRAMYISRNNELLQEFFFAHQKTKIWINNVYNTSFYGSPLWDIFSKNYIRLEKSWNVSQRIMLNLPRTTHRFFLEPLSETMHIVKSLKKRFINFISKIRESKKHVLRRVLHEIENDCRSTTGRNIRKLCLEYKVSKLADIDINENQYKEIPEGDDWKIGMVDEINNLKNGCLEIVEFTVEEVDEICKFICSS